MQIKHPLSLAVELRYASGYDLTGLSREGIGVYLGNLLSQLTDFSQIAQLYVIIEPSQLSNCKTFLLENKINNKVLAISKDDNLVMLNDKYDRFILFYDSQKYYPDPKQSEKPGFRYDLKLAHWLTALKVTKSLIINLKANIKFDSLFEVYDDINKITITTKSYRNKLPIKEVYAHSITAKGCDLISLDEKIVVNAVDIQDCSSLELAISVDYGIAAIFSIDNVSIILQGIRPGDVFSIDRESSLDTTTRINNSTIDAVLFHHIDTYHSKYEKKSIYHLHDLLFLEHGYKYIETGFDLEYAKDLILKCYETPSKIKNDSLIIFSSKHVEEEQFKRPFPYKYSKIKSTIVRNTFIASDFQNLSGDMDNELHKQLLMLYPYVTYPTQPRPTKQFCLLLEIVEKLIIHYPSLKLVLTCEEEVYKSCYQEYIPSYVYFIGALPRKDLYYLYNNSLACIVTTCFEASLPWQFLEALLADTVSVCYCSKIVDEFINEGYIDEEIAKQIIFSSADEAVIQLRDAICNRTDGLNRGHTPSEIVKELAATLPNTSWHDISSSYLQKIEEFVKV